MNKKPGFVAIFVAVLMSIILFLPIVGSGLVSGVCFSVQSMLQPDREMDLYRSFEKNGGVDFIYDILLDETGEEMTFTEDISVNTRELFPKEDVAEIMEGIYQAFFKGENYSIKFDSQKAYLQDKAMEYFEQNIDDAIKEELGDLYEYASESEIQEAKDIARKEYKAEVDSVIEKEVASLEAEFSGVLDVVYESPEYQEVMDILEEEGYRLDDREKLCSDIGLAGNVFLVIGVILVVLLLLCHLFRPAGFVTAGVFSLLTGGILKGGAIVIPSTISKLAAEETLEGEPIPDFLVALVEDIMNWFVEGFHKAGMLALGFGVVLFLVGILLFVIRRNQAEA